MITEEIAKSIGSSVLCWLATVSEDGLPNVSPKEAFLHDGEGKILVANIASPKTVRNIDQTKNVCLSFVNVFIQKGYKITGKAKVWNPGSVGYEDRLRKLISEIGETFPIISIIEIDPTETEEIIAPSYRLFPDSGPLDRIRESLSTYEVINYQKRAERDAGDQLPIRPESNV